MIDVRLGKQPPRHDPRTLQLANYLQPRIHYGSADWGKAVKNWPMMLNDKIGDCTIAAAAHLVEMWSVDTQRGEVTIPDSQVEVAYSAVTGYKPSDPSTDCGANETDVLNYWRKIGIGGHVITAYVALEPGNHRHIEDACEIFGGVYIGLNMPLSAQRQPVWSVPPGGPVGGGAPGSWGGHAVPIVQYDRHGLTCVTWGGLKRMTWGFWAGYCDEAYAVLSPDWIEAGGHTPSGLDLAGLMVDLKEVTG